MRRHPWTVATIRCLDAPLSLSPVLPLIAGIHDVQLVWPQVGRVRGQDQRLQHVQSDTPLYKVR